MLHLFFLPLSSSLHSLGPDATEDLQGHDQQIRKPSRLRVVGLESSLAFRVCFKGSASEIKNGASGLKVPNQLELGLRQCDYGFGDGLVEASRRRAVAS